MRALATLVVVSGCFTLFAWTAPNASAQQKQGGDKKDSKDTTTINPVGRPAKFDEGQATRCVLWFEDGSWQIRSTCKKGEQAEFKGEVIVKDGTVTEGLPIGLEKGKKPRKVRQDMIFLRPDRKSFEFRFRSAGAVDGLYFKTSEKATEVTIRIFIDGDDNPKHVFIGAKGQHPATGTFTLPAHP